MPFVTIGLSHHTSPVAVRERFAFPEAKVPSALRNLRDAGLAEEGVILSTCNRVELYVSTSLQTATAFDGLKEFLHSCHGIREPVGCEFYTLGEPHSVYHLFKVAAGLDSMVLGETEILGQLKKAYDFALQNGFTGGCLNRTFQKAFNVAKQIRTETNIQRGSVSVASAAVELAEKIFGELDEREVLVIGAGDTSEKTAKALLSRGAKNIVVTNRSHEKAAALALQLGGRALEFDHWEREFANIDVVISSTSSPDYIIDAARLGPLMKVRRNRPLLLVDIAVPRDISPAVQFMENVFLYNVDDLQAIAADCLKQRQDEVSRCEDIIREKARALLESRAPRDPISAAPVMFAGTNR